MSGFYCAAVGLRRQTGRYCGNVGTHSHACPDSDRNVSAYAGTYPDTNSHARSHANGRANAETHPDANNRTYYYANSTSNTQAYAGTHV